MDFINIMEIDREEEEENDEEDNNGIEECSSLIKRKKRYTDVHKLVEEHNAVGKSSILTF